MAVGAPSMYHVQSSSVVTTEVTVALSELISVPLSLSAPVAPPMVTPIVRAPRSVGAVKAAMLQPANSFLFIHKSFPRLCCDYATPILEEIVIVTNPLSKSFGANFPIGGMEFQDFFGNE
jgi:hypothetical protein